MTVKEMKKTLKKLPDDMQVMMPLNSDTDFVVSVCKENSTIQEIVFDEATENVLMLVPCNCQIETDEIEVEACSN